MLMRAASTKGRSKLVHAPQWMTCVHVEASIVIGVCVLAMPRHGAVELRSPATGTMLTPPERRRSRPRSRPDEATSFVQRSVEELPLRPSSRISRYTHLTERQQRRRSSTTLPTNPVAPVRKTTASAPTTLF